MSITMTTVILFAVFGVLLFLGVPISISIVASSIVTAMSTLSWDLSLIHIFLHGGMCYNKSTNLQGDSRYAGPDIRTGIYQIQTALL